MKQFVCAFRGRRDAYQVPLALAESGRLNRFITDAYAGPVLGNAARCLLKLRWQEKVLARREAGIPDKLVKCLWPTTLLEHARHWSGCSRAVTFAKLDQHFSRAAARVAARNRAHLFLYSPYAWEAFNQKYSHAPLRVLFQFHPHPDAERRILAEDFERYPLVAESYTSETGTQLSEALQRRTSDVWRHADLIFCASSFTRQTLIEAGAKAAICRVIPYGVELPDIKNRVRPVQPFTALFVGSGSQRKGLHHLLLAWKQAKLASDSRLILVCRVIDPGIEELASRTPGVSLRRGVSHSELGKLFHEASIFAMPSLVEGFGQVYLEALAYGCPVLGTPNTCLPDLGAEDDGILLTPPGNIDALAHKLEYACERLRNDTEIRRRAQACAARFGWADFRKQLISDLSAI